MRSAPDTIPTARAKAPSSRAGVSKSRFGCTFFLDKIVSHLKVVPFGDYRDLVALQTEQIVAEI
jgi:hypothetical protein